MTKLCTLPANNKETVTYKTVNMLTRPALSRSLWATLSVQSASRYFNVVVQFKVANINYFL